ncbi:hypothetical protein KKB44_02455 [Candidatus Micrarchaeota archaeon]|nr:hypothetical protein [Candidatus Micrarchaeota archaeon]
MAGPITREPERDMATLQELDDLLQRLQQMNLTPEQQQYLVDMLESALEQMRAPQSVSPDLIPRRSEEAPQRQLTHYVYEVDINGDRYWLDFNTANPNLTEEDRQALRNGTFDGERLHDLLLHNRLVASGANEYVTVIPRGTPLPPEEQLQRNVEYVTFTPQQEEFARQSQDARLDIFRDHYLALTNNQDQYVASADVTITYRAAR